MCQSICLQKQSLHNKTCRHKSLTEIAYKLYRGSRKMSFLWWGVSRSALTSECPLLWLLSCPNPFTMITSQSLLEASSDQVSCAFASDPMWFSPSVTVLCSVSISLSLLLLQASRFSLLLQSRCRLPSWGRRRRPCFRPVFLGLLLGLLFLLSGLPTLLIEHGVPETTKQWLENLMLVCKKRKKREEQTSARSGRTGHSSSGDGGHRGVSSLQSLELLYQAFTLQALQAAHALSHLPWGEERTGVKALAWKLHNLLRLNPATIDKLEALQMNNLKKHIENNILTKCILQKVCTKTLKLQYGFSWLKHKPLQFKKKDLIYTHVKFCL